MKKLIVLALVVASGFSFAAKSLNVSVSQENNNVGIRFTTVERYSSMCGMTVTKLDLSYGNLTFRPEVEDGKIEISAQTLPGTMCLASLGPHRGGATFSRGTSLPSLRNGRYALEINNEAHGTLVVSGKEVTLEK